MDKNISKTKQEIFDIILIGSGPSAVAALSSIAPELRVLVVDKCVKPSHKVDELKNQVGNELVTKKTITETVNFLFKAEKKFFNQILSRKNIGVQTMFMENYKKIVLIFPKHMAGFLKYGVLRVSPTPF